MDLYKRTESVLYNYKNTLAEIKNIDLEIEHIEYVGCGAMSYEEKSAPTNQFSSSVENEVILREKKKQQLSYLKVENVLLVSKINNALETLDVRSHDIISMKYFNNLNYRDISIKLDLTEEYIGNLKKEIVRKLSGLIFV